jgi:hypothetical protein
MKRWVAIGWNSKVGTKASSISLERAIGFELLSLERFHL